MFDRLMALAAIVALLPVFLVVAAAVASDGGPVFFRQTRVGQNERRFQCLKFRSMYVGADARLGRILAEDEAAAAEWARNQKLRHDPRVTRVGSFLRKTSLDEILQLFNVLKGEMSLVGPRPITDAEITRYGSDRDLYYRFKPGITGLWQVSGRSEICYHQRVALDTWYVKNWTLARDIQILMRTIPALLRRTGAI